jgi:hypothetical protein
MKMRIPVAAKMLATLLMLATHGSPQAPPKVSTFTIAGHTGEAELLQIDGKSYVEIETLARLTKGTLSFKGNETILTLPHSDAEAQASASNGRVGLSTGFVRAAIEEMSLVREWRAAIVYAVQKNTPVSEGWVSAQHRLAEKIWRLLPLPHPQTTITVPSRFSPLNSAICKS